MPMKNKQIFMKFVSLTTVCSILVPLVIICIWAVAMRWSWPDLLPAALSTRGISELFSSHSGALQVLLSSIALSLLAAFFATAIGYMSAHAFALYDFWGKSLLRFGSMLPLIVPANVFAMGIHVSFIRWNLIDTFLGVLICHVLYSLPYTISLLTEMKVSIGDKYEQQASVLGCSSIKSFLLITLPITLPAMFSAFSMAYIISFSQYFLTMLIGGGKIKTFSVIMVPFISGGDRTIASSYALMFLGSSLLVFLLFEYVVKKLVVGYKG